MNGAYSATVTLESSDPAKATVRPSTLRFASGDTDTPQTVTVTGRAVGEAVVSHAVTLDGAAVRTPAPAGTVAVTVTEAETRPPRAPKAFRARPGDGEVTLSWAKGDAAIVRYEVIHRLAGPGQAWGAWAEIAGSGADTTTHTVGGLTNGRKYIFRVRAVNAGGAGPRSRGRGATPMGTLTVAVEEAAVVEGDDGRRQVEFVVTLSGEPTDDVKVRVAALAGPGSTATEAEDFVALDETLVFDASARKDALMKTVRVEVLGDHRAEGDETFVLRLDRLETGDGRVALAGGGEKLRVTGTITDDDAAPVLADIEDTYVAGPDVMVDVTASATDADGDPVRYTWKRKKGETTPAIPKGTDLSSARLFFDPPGVGTYSMLVTADDGHGNSDYRELVITVRSVPTVSVPAVVRVTEGTDANAVVTVTASRAFGRSVTFDVTYGGQATGAADPANGDYDNDAVTSVRFGPSDTTRTITIPLTDDRRDEAEETITVTIAPAQGSTLPEGFVLSAATATVVITDDDASPVLADIGDRSVIGQEVDITASATDADGDPISFTWRRKTGETTPALPEGTDLNAARLFFTPPGVGVYTMTLTAEDGHGNSDSATVTITVWKATPAEMGGPSDLTVERRQDKLHLSWTAPEHPERTGWQARYRTYNSSIAAYETWHDWVTIDDPSATSHVLTSDECLPWQEVELRATTKTGATLAASAQVVSEWGTQGYWGVRIINNGYKRQWPLRLTPGFASNGRGGYTIVDREAYEAHRKWRAEPPAEGDAMEYKVSLRRAPSAPAQLVPLAFDRGLYPKVTKSPGQARNYLASRTNLTGRKNVRRSSSSDMPGMSNSSSSSALLGW